MMDPYKRVKEFQNLIFGDHHKILNPKLPTGPKFNFYENISPDYPFWELWTRATNPEPLTQEEIEQWRNRDKTWSPKPTCVVPLEYLHKYKFFEPWKWKDQCHWYELSLKKVASYGNSRLLKYWVSLDEDEKRSLTYDILTMDFDDLKLRFEKAVEEKLNRGTGSIDYISIEPVEREIYGSSSDSDEKTLGIYEAKGLEAISRGQVAVILLAGGKGTRLGITYPKGMYDLRLPSRKTLYQIQAERLRRIQTIASEKSGVPDCRIPWYIMTSDEQEGSLTQDYFTEHKFFGLDPENVMFFEQEMIPCFDFSGHLILESKYSVAKSPDGNGGLFEVLRSRGILDDMKLRRISYFHVYCVDNILVKMADPHFIGYCIDKGVECGTKVVEKTNPNEALGVVCKMDGRYRVAEYSEISKEAASKRDPDGGLTFRAGSICNHFFKIEFLSRAVEQFDLLQYHACSKAIPCVRVNSRRPQKIIAEHATPAESNGIKLEKFIFDVFPFATTFAVWEVPRMDEFSPLKNRSNHRREKYEGTPAAVRNALYSYHGRLVKAAGARLIDLDETKLKLHHKLGHSGDDRVSNGLDGDNRPPVIELSPLLTSVGEGLEFMLGHELQPPVTILHSCEKESASFEKKTHSIPEFNAKTLSRPHCVLHFRTLAVNPVSGDWSDLGLRILDPVYRENPS